MWIFVNVLCIVFKIIWLIWLVNWLLNVTFHNISVKLVTAQRCAGGLKKKVDIRSCSLRHRLLEFWYDWIDSISYIIIICREEVLQRKSLNLLILSSQQQGNYGNESRSRCCQLQPNSTTSSTWEIWAEFGKACLTPQVKSSAMRRAWCPYGNTNAIVLLLTDLLTCQTKSGLRRPLNR